MNVRKERGLVIAATAKLVRKGKVWLVPSQTGNGKKYTVVPDGETPYCSCPDHEEHGGMCKHLYAVELSMKRDQAADGTITETRTITLTEKKTYRQPSWPLYNLCQVEEKRRFLVLLNDLCRGLADPPQNTTGRRRTAMRDMIFTVCLKVFSGFSARRFGTDLDAAFEQGYLTKKLHPGMSWKFLECPLLTPVLKQLIGVTALPLRAVETTFAVDSTGFSTSRFERYYDIKYGTHRSGKTWTKCHMAVGTKTHVCTAVIIDHRDAADCPQFVPLVRQTAENFTIDEVSGDKAYLSVENIEEVFRQGGTPYIAFKADSTGASGGLFEKMFHYYSLHREEYAAHYHKRSNIESSNSMIKAKFGDSLLSRSETAMVNETLVKLVCHNLCCLIASQVELGIEATFWGKVPPKPIQADIPQAILAPVEPPAVAVQPATIHRFQFVGA